ncbi:MAG: BatD family protein [Gammaproteobacteria bacterium]|nr:BatD family protein [Gammaproteobacteria bacterium]
MRAQRIARMALVFVAVSAGAQTVELSVESRDIYAGMPFNLVLSAKGFEEESPPDAPGLAIDGCRVTYIGMTPSVSQQIQIVNGRRSEWREVTFVYRWQVMAPSAGRYTVPAVTLSQGEKSVTSRAGAFDVGDLEQTADMIVRMRLPDRAVWVGETFDGAVEWLLARDVESYELVVPLFDLDAVRVEGTEESRRMRSFRAGAGAVDLSMHQDRVRENGIDYTRIRFPFRATVTRAQSFDLDPLRVVARLESPGRRSLFDFSTFGRNRGALFQASGQRQQLVVRPLPESGRPPNFVNAVGAGFSIEVQASRTVVSAGDPIELTIRIRGDGELEGLSLPPLVGEGGLPPALFSIPADAAVGSVDPETRTKTFGVTARVLSVEVREIPPIEFPYFDPTRGEYVTVTSRPVALSVAGGNVVGAADVTAAAPAPAVPATDPARPAANSAALMGADMSLSATNRTLALPWGSTVRALPMALLYLLPLVIVGLRVWQTRTAAGRGRRREIARARREVERVLESGGSARETAPQVLNAMRALARLTGHENALAAGALERCETSAFDPASAGEPLDGDLAAAIRSLAHDWARRGSG